VGIVRVTLVGVAEIKGFEMRKPILATALLLLFIFIGVGAVWAQSGGRYYPETGHTVDPYFLPTFNGLGGLDILGYPITDAFIDPVTGLLIQYFQNSRLELYPVRTDGVWNVRLSPLGEILGGWQTVPEGSSLPVGTKPGCKYFKASDHWVCHAFREYFESHGGQERFGFPISEFTLENGRLVQHFQNFRLDWHPEGSTGTQVRVAPLGLLHFEQMGYDRALRRPQAPNSTFRYQTLQLHVKSSVEAAVVGPNDPVYISVQVRDQQHHPVRGAAVVLTAHFTEDDFIQLMPVTDPAGISKIALENHDQPPGNVVNLEFWVVYGEIQATTRDSYRVWW
jgi:hypothetical protein